MIRRLLSGVLGKYEFLLSNYPIRTQALTSGVLALVGDVFTQKLEDNIRDKKEREKKLLSNTQSNETEHTSNSLDIRRNASITVFGLWYGWWGHYWYHYLDTLAHKAGKIGSLKFVGTKVMAEQVFWNPATLVAYFVSVSIMEGKSKEFIKQKMTEDFAPTLAIELATCPALTAIIFKYSPVRYQLAFINVMELFYDAFLSWIQHNGYHLPGAKHH
eukprot:TRINITY_DN4804_c0_g1_i2.p1 TRINITY_DN4804_c0_g1~~TRINITY_DN4804_c0_g1_i2.p1  ORF type:complete len:216 (+),score=29.65 TRINITY_DN4804_c0_g1_i2:24-671(+)